MAHVYLDREGDRFAVRVLTGIVGDKTTRFDDRAAAMAFAERKMGRRGMIVDTTMMTHEQLADHRARQERARAVIAELGR